MFDLSAGGRADYTMTSPRGEISRGSWRFVSIDPRMAMDQVDAALQDLRSYAQGAGTRTEILDDQHVRHHPAHRRPPGACVAGSPRPRPAEAMATGSRRLAAGHLQKVGDSCRYVWQEGDDESTRFGFDGETVLSRPTWRAVTTERMIGMDGPTTLNDLQLY